MAGKRELQMVVTADARQAQRALGNLERTAGQTGKKTERALSGIQSGLVGLGGAGLAVGAFRAFEDSERIGRQLEQVIKSTGGAAHVSAGQVDELVQSLSKKGGVDDEELTSGATRLMQYKNIANQVGKNNDIFNQATEAAANYSARTGKDAVAANTLLGKSLSAPIESLGVLRKAGIRLTEEQEEQIKTGDLLAGQRIILAEFEKKYGGALEANATASGKAKVAVDNMAESVGGVLAPALGTGAKALGTFADGFSHLPKSVQSATVGIVGLSTAAAWAGPRIFGMYQSMSSGLGTARAFTALTVDATKNRAAGVSRTSAAISAMGDISGKSAPKIGKLGFAIGALGAATAGAEIAAWGQSMTDALPSTQRLLGATNDDLVRLAAMWAEFDTSKFVKAGREDIGTLLAMRDAVKAAGGDMPALDKAIAKVRAETERATKRNKEHAASTEDAAGKARGHKEAVKDGAWSLRDFGDAAKTAASETDYAAKSTEDNKNRLIELAAAAKEAESRIDDFYDAQHRGLKTQIDVEEAWDKYRDSLFTNGKSTDIKTPGGRSNQESLIALTETMLEATKVERDRTAALGDGTYATEAAIQKMQVYSLNLQDTMIKAGYTKDEVKVMIEAMGLTPAQIKTVFESNQVAQEQELRKGLLATIFSVPTDRTTNFHANTKPAMDDIRAMIAALAAQTPVGTLIPSPYGPIPGTLEFPAGKARGGPVSGGTTYMVGERGPELFTPRSSGTIIPNHRLRSAGSPVVSGGSTTVVIQLDGREISRRVINTANGQTRRTGRSPLVAGGRR